LEPNNKNGWVIPSHFYLTNPQPHAILKEKGVTPRIEKSAEILGVSLGISAFF
jgi:hypothetical protein